MYSTVLEHILYPIGEKMLGTTMLKYLEELDKTQWWSPSQLQEMQNKKLRALIKHVYENVPYYRRVFDERGLTDKDIQTVEDLPKLPILTKEDIRQNFPDLMTRDFKKWRIYPASTSGSAGEPLSYYLTMDVASISWAALFRAWGWAGYKLGDKLIMFGGTSVVGSNISTKSRLRYLLERKIPLSSFAMTEQKMGNYIQRIRKFNPRYIYGYPSAISSLADYISKKGQDSTNLQAVFTTAETLLPSQRATIENVFSCKVFDQYSVNDGGAMALECPAHNGYHLVPERAIVEFMTNGKEVLPGKPGEIVATDLHNYAMPFIRYATGDMGVLSGEQCSCGRGLPVVKSLGGRVIDLIVLKDGSRVSGLPLTDVFEHIEGVQRETFKQYQIIQESIGRIVVKIVRGANYREHDTPLIIGEFKKHLGEDTTVEIQFVDEITTTKAGKHRFVISKVSQ